MIAPIWLPAALIGGALQAWRTAVQRRVSRTLSINAAGLVRYLYGLPVAVLLVIAYEAVFARTPFPALGVWFVPFCLGGGLAQIIATNLLLMAFGERNFVVGTAYSKTEAVQSALLSVFLLGDHLSLPTWVGIGFGVAGVMVLSTGGKRMAAGAFLRALGQPAARYGIASGFMFALTTIGIRAATQAVATPDHIRAALIVLATTVAAQTVAQGAYLLLRERDQVARVFSEWRVAGQVGLMSSVASACWFTGFASAPVALVRIVGQIEVAFTMAFAHFYLGEKTSRSEILGLILVAIGVVFALVGSL
ncbi:drug/metabolite transporter (DMT)-like permease [Sphingomonas sp. BE270]|uniref:EamA family transporter n=2 Tax=Pseudomonadota TaxID=1224 RepID=UPI00053E7CB8|nr:MULTISPECIES: EamA family transporter [unclassified Sphingomonas]MDR6850008.1 drug/metabolite transporter (DMT)-like permease [Sphingomonas sp. BE137]MDR7259762.1 drug/metabolite transporter (DMT)-like permease [Sphingomonas sp. BE270]